MVVGAFLGVPSGLTGVFDCERGGVRSAMMCNELDR